MLIAEARKSHIVVSGVAAMVAIWRRWTQLLDARNADLARLPASKVSRLGGCRMFTLARLRAAAEARDDTSLVLLVLAAA